MKENYKEEEVKIWEEYRERARVAGVKGGRIGRIKRIQEQTASKLKSDIIFSKLKYWSRSYLHRR